MRQCEVVNRRVRCTADAVWRVRSEGMDVVVCEDCLPLLEARSELPLWSEPLESADYAGVGVAVGMVAIVGGLFMLAMLWNHFN